MKRVTFKVAKAIKNAGYPQDEINITKIGWYNQAGIYTTELPFLWEGDDMFVAIAPTYLEVWLWLWREKRFPIDAECMEKLQRKIAYNIWENGILSERYDDPEEAIISAINYLVDNNLIN